MPSGNEIGTASSDVGDFEFYLNWLADYLYETDIPVPECQRLLTEHYRTSGGCSAAVGDLGFRLGYTSYDVEEIERDYAEGNNWEDFHANERAGWESLSEDEQETQTEEEFFIWKDEYERIGREGLEGRVVPDFIRHADIPYRGVLATLIKEIKEPGSRQRLLHSFYRELNDIASK